MINLPREEALKVWDKFWNDTTDEFFKVEDLQDYADEQSEQQSSLSLWLAGDKKASIESIKIHQSEWARQTSSKKICIHIYDEPLSEYLQWEIAHYKLVTIPFGDEEVYLVKREDVPDYNLGDFMIFDNKNIAKSCYSSGGYLESIDLYQDEAIQKFIDAKEQLMRFAHKLTASMQVQF